MLRDELAVLLGSLPFETEQQQRALLQLRSGDAPARAAAAAALAATGTAALAPLLGSSLHDADEAVHAAVEEALWALWVRSGDAAADAAFETGMVFLRSASLPGAARSDALQDALASFESACDAFPWHAEAWNKKATVLFLLERWAESVAACERVVELNPLHFGALSGAAMCCIRLRDEERAEGFFSRALEANPRLGAARSFRDALRLRRQGRRREE